jgi:hypothetical protein
MATKPHQRDRHRDDLAQLRERRRPRPSDRPGRRGRRRDPRAAEGAAERAVDHAGEAANIDVHGYVSLIDGASVVQIDTNEGTGRVRVFLNDGTTTTATETDAAPGQVYTLRDLDGTDEPTTGSPRPHPRRPGSRLAALPAGGGTVTETSVIRHNRIIEGSATGHALRRSRSRPGRATNGSTRSTEATTTGSTPPPRSRAPAASWNGAHRARGDRRRTAGRPRGGHPHDPVRPRRTDDHRDVATARHRVPRPVGRAGVRGLRGHHPPRRARLPAQRGACAPATTPT